MSGFQSAIVFAGRASLGRVTQHSRSILCVRPEIGNLEVTMHTWKAPLSFSGFRNGAVALAFLIVYACLPAAGQTVNGSFRGKVTDPSGAVIPGANVTMTDTAKGVSRDTKTDASGYYEFLDVPPSTYDFTVSFIAFEALNNRGVVL